MKNWLFAAAALAALTGCNEKSAASPQPCYSLTPGTASQPYASILVDACSGQTWLLVKVNGASKPNESFTYQWMSIERLDYAHPTLTGGK